jgi:hypothetical protein
MVSQTDFARKWIMNIFFDKLMNYIGSVVLFSLLSGIAASAFAADKTNDDPAVFTEKTLNYLLERIKLHQRNTRQERIPIAAARKQGIAEDNDAIEYAEVVDGGLVIPYFLSFAEPLEAGSDEVSILVTDDARTDSEAVQAFDRRIQALNKQLAGMHDTIAKDYADDGHLSAASEWQIFALGLPADAEIAPRRDLDFSDPRVVDMLARTYTLLINNMLEQKQEQEQEQEQ